MQWIERKPKSSSSHDSLYGIVSAAEGEKTQKKSGGGSGEEDSAKGDGGQKMKKKGDELKEEMDDLVEEIDDLLEENAEEFVKNYVQRGGE